jgi:phosphoribosylformylglycinamidine synthase
MKPKALVLRSAGTNCDAETAHALELAGAEVVRLHVNRLIERPGELHEYQMLVIPGGFSYGDDIASGRILANQLVHRLGDDLRRFIEDGKPVGGICNGFQVLVKTGLLPGGATATKQTATLTHNAGHRFIDRWVHLKCPKSVCAWTSELQEGSAFELPIAHGEGRFVAESEGALQSLGEHGQVAVVYVRPDGSAAGGEEPHNPNGSAADIAGVCDETGLVFGLMPHPERHVSALQHYAWTSRQWAGQRESEAPGVAFFRSAVARAEAGARVGV